MCVLVGFSRLGRLNEVLLKPVGGLLRHLFECSRFFKQMRRPGNDGQLLGTAEKPIGMLIHLNDRIILASNQEQGRCGNLRQVGFGEVRPSAA